MKIEERSYNSKLIRPKPVVYSENDLIVIATSWGQGNHAQKVVDEVSKYIDVAKADVEVTSPFEFLSCLPDEVNYLRTAIQIANEGLYRSENRGEYESGVELTVLYKKRSQIAWAQVGAPAIMLKRGSIPLQPLSAPIDLSMELSPDENFLSPLPSQLLGLEPTCDIKVGHFNSRPKDQVILLSCSRLPRALWSVKSSILTLPELTSCLVQGQEEQPFWLGIVDLDEGEGF